MRLCVRCKYREVPRTPGKVSYAHCRMCEADIQMERFADRMFFQERVAVLLAVLSFVVLIAYSTLSL